MNQGFVNELNYLLTISKHPRTVQLLQDALEHEKRSPHVVNGDDRPHQKCVSGTDSRVPSEPATVKASGRTATGRITTKIKEYGEYGVTMLYWHIIKDSMFLLGWDQSETYVKIYITTIPGLDQISTENVINEFTNKYEVHNKFRSLVCLGKCECSLVP